MSRYDVIGAVIEQTARAAAAPPESAAAVNPRSAAWAQHGLRDHGRPSAYRRDGYIFFGSVKPPSFRAFSSTGMAAAEAPWHVLSAVATEVAGSVSK
jgi:hypothetical protein